MKSYRDIIYIVIILLLCVFGYVEWQNSKIEIRNRDSAIREKDAVITYKTNREGKIIAEKDAAVLNAKEMREFYPKVVDKIEKSFDVKVKNLKAYMENAFAAQGHGTGTVINNNFYDSAAKKMVAFRDFSMDDGYLKFDTRLYDSLRTQAPYAYVYRDTVTTVLSSDKRWWQVFRNEHIIGKTSFGNPNSKSVSMTSILKGGDRDKRWALVVGLSYVPFLPTDKPIEKIQPTLTFGYTILKF